MHGCGCEPERTDSTPARVCGSHLTGTTVPSQDHRDEVVSVGTRAASDYASPTVARVVKQVDTRDLKSLGGNSVPVRFRPRAPAFRWQLTRPAWNKSTLGRDGTSPSPTIAVSSLCMNSERDGTSPSPTVARVEFVHEFGTGRDKPVPYDRRVEFVHEFGTGRDKPVLQPHLAAQLDQSRHLVVVEVIDTSRGELDAHEPHERYVRVEACADACAAAVGRAQVQRGKRGQ